MKQEVMKDKKLELKPCVKKRIQTYIFILKHNFEFIMQLGKQKIQNSTNPCFILFP